MAALKGLLLYNPYSMALKTHLNNGCESVQTLMPQQVSCYLSNFIHKEIPHFPAPGYITDYSWHPKTDKIAIALKDDSIKVWTRENANLVPLLKHKKQVGISVIAWKPLVGTAI